MIETLNKPDCNILLVSNSYGPGIDGWQVLESAGYRVARAVGAGDAIRHYTRDEACHVVIIDLAVPELDAATLIEELRELDLSRNWVSFVLVGASTLEQVSAAARLQVADILPAAASGEQIVTAVSEAFDLARAQKLREEDHRALHASLQDFKSRTYAALTQLMSHAKGSGALAGETGFVLSEEMDEGQLVRLVQGERLRARLRERLMGDLGLGASGWMLLLVLADARLAGCSVTIKSVAYDAGLPLSTALRKLNEMVAIGLVERREDTEDARRSFVSLTARGQASLARYFTELARSRDAAAPAPPRAAMGA
ncbi:MAG: winged helix DNA-binding protein [Alphaproteobacteria bacterium]|nr:winged helix DNA-binding protein [Alphaproteobacteria bacterium]